MRFQSCPKGRTFLLLVCLNLKKRKGKKMKRILSLLIILAISITALASCGIVSIFGEVEDEGEVTVLVEAADGSYEVYKTYLESIENKEEGAKGVVEHLNKSDDSLYLVMNESTYGAFVTEIGSIKQDESKSEYIMVYTSIASDSYEGAPSVDYEGVTLYQSGVGLSGMKVEEGTIILFRIETY